MGGARRWHRLFLSTGLFALSLAGVPAAHAEWVADAEGSFVYEDNLTRAARRADRRGDAAFAPALSVGQYLQLTDATGLLATADVKGSVYSELERLSNLASTVTLGVRHKLGLGAFAPWLRVFAAGGVLVYGDDVRDSALVDAGVQLGKRLTERVDVQGGYTYERLDAHNGVFDQDAHTVSLRAGVGLSGSLQLTLGYALRWGDLVIHKAPTPGAPPTPHSRLVDTFDTPLVAARIVATTHLWSLAVSYALTSHAALSAGWEYQLSLGPRLSYPNNLVRASFDYSF